MIELASSRELTFLFLQLVTRRELTLFTSAEFDWRPLDGSLNQPPATHENIAQTQLLGRFEIEFSLSKRRVDRVGSIDTSQYSINEAHLEEIAFQPRRLSIRMESGQFLSSDDMMWEILSAPKFQYRLIFEPSPYPPRHAWKEPHRVADVMEFWEWKTFVSHLSA